MRRRYRSTRSSKRTRQSSSDCNQALGGLNGPRCDVFLEPYVCVYVCLWWYIVREICGEPPWL